MNPIIKELLDKAIENNVIVYDPVYAKMRVYTKNLELSAQKHFSETKDYIELIIEDPLQIMSEYYKSKECEMPYETTKLVLFVGQTKCCFGAY